MSITEFGQRSFITWTAEDLRKEREAEKEKKMRKFRAWDKHKKEWIDPDIISIDGTGELHILNMKSLLQRYTPEILAKFIDIQFFTGLKDKTGKDLDWWEGDIFTRSSDGKIEGVVIYDLGCFWLDRKRGGRNLLYECVDWSMYKIGDIHTTPELLEQK